MDPKEEKAEEIMQDIAPRKGKMENTSGEANRQSKEKV